MNHKQFKVGENYPCFIVAEIGTSHMGKIKTAHALIDAAKSAGADAVKFQLIYADEIIHPMTGEIELPGGKIDLYQRFKQIEQDMTFYKQVKTYSEKMGLFFLCTPFGIRSARILNNMNISAIKIASPELNHIPLLKEISRYNCRIILSTGVSTLSDIEKVLSITGNKTVLLHCITSYPAPEEEYNLRLIPNLKGIFGVPVGLSDHSESCILVPALAAAMGAVIIEKHFTLSKAGNGLDDSIALKPKDFTKMTSAIRKAEKLKKKGTIKWLTHEYGPKKVESILGNGIKILARSEAANYYTTRRSIHAQITINPGESISKKNASILRTEKNLKVGLDPEYLPILLGKPVKRKIMAGDGIVWEDII